ncbi:hypothetical protein KPC83_06000 [Collinsella sp. zg1085]|uniref:hypothetical protein n=1 Tax=Collinsella sp. zg1085 TaxID=2844380 RepID=UPI001C0D8251|nr:hypothetical protein [Collinsella sp. zg1085]QWT17390.1 hypothetical protein KPC83_06000 [Collinsella sp. zg1085]
MNKRVKQMAAGLMVAVTLLGCTCTLVFAGGAPSTAQYLPGPTGKTAIQSETDISFKHGNVLHVRYTWDSETKQMYSVDSVYQQKTGHGVSHLVWRHRADLTPDGYVFGITYYVEGEGWTSDIVQLKAGQ